MEIGFLKRAAVGTNAVGGPPGLRSSLLSIGGIILNQFALQFQLGIFSASLIAEEEHLVSIRHDNISIVSQSHFASPFGHHNANEQRRTRRSEEHTSELQSLMRLSYAVFCLHKKTT